MLCCRDDDNDYNDVDVANAQVIIEIFVLITHPRAALLHVDLSRDSCEPASCWPAVKLIQNKNIHFLFAPF